MIKEYELGLETSIAIGEAAMQDTIGNFKLSGPVENLKIPEAFAKSVESFDKNPMYITLGIKSGFSRLGIEANRNAPDTPHRYWPPESIQGLISQVNEGGLPGYRGHTDLTTLPNVAVNWVAASEATHIQTGEAGGLFRGYVYDVDNNRPEIRTGVINSGSVVAMIEVKPKVIEKQRCSSVEQSNFLSIDLVRKGTEGMRETKIVATEGANMPKELAAEIVALLGGMDASTLKMYNPKLAAELSGNADKLSVADNNLLDRVQELTLRSANLMAGDATASEAAKLMGCEVTGLLEEIRKLLTLRKTAVEMAINDEISKITSKSLQELCKKRLVAQEIATVEEVKPAVESVIEFCKAIIATKADENSLGSVDDDTSGKKKKFSIASSDMKAAMGSDA